MPTIFISYRRADAEGDAGRLHAELAERIPGARLFMDVVSLAPGEVFVEVLKRTLLSADVVLVVVGRSWLQVTNQRGERRIDDPDDLVRLEVATALERGLHVIPVLVQATPMPREADLPEPLKALARRNAVELRHTRYEDDVASLVTQLGQILNVPTGVAMLRRPPGRLPIPTSVLIRVGGEVLVVVVAFIAAYRNLFPRAEVDGDVVLTALVLAVGGAWSTEFAWRRVRARRPG